MFITRIEVGAICHGMLPNCRSKNSCVGECAERFKYVDCSIKRMLGLFEKMNIGKSEIVVKIFGGADMFDVGEVRQHLTVGRQNIDSARRLISSNGLKVVASDIGGVNGRKIIFHTHTGEVFLRRINRSEFDTVSRRRIPQ
jgi:chemotaxis protein CheD